MYTILSFISIFLFLSITSVVADGREMLCNQSIDLTIDSALYLSSTQLYLFSGDQYYRLNLRQTNDFMSDRITNIYSKLSPPIDVSYVDHKGNIRLWNFDKWRNWRFLANWKYDMNTKLDPKYQDTIDRLSIFKSLVDLRNYKVDQGLELRYIADNGSDDMVLTRKGDQVILIDQAEFMGKYNKPEYLFHTLNGKPIGAAFVGEESAVGKRQLYLFANRFWCQMEISRSEWTHFCDIKDISQLVDCSYLNDTSQQTTTDSTQSSSSNTIAIVLVAIFVVIGSIFVVIILVIIWKRKSIKKNSKVWNSNDTSSLSSSSVHLIDSKTGLMSDKRKISELKIEDPSQESQAVVQMDNK